jgi:hypothetical protein
VTRDFIDNKVIISWVVFTATSFLMSLEWFESEEMSNNGIIIWCLVIPIVSAIKVFVLRYFTNGLTKSKEKTLGVWGYVWRFLIADTLSALVAVIFIMIIPVLEHHVFVTVLSLFLYVIFVFLLFCKSKKDKFREAISIFGIYGI